MGLYVNSSCEEIFELLVKYFVEGRARIIFMHKPMYLKVEIGKLLSIWFGEALGEAEIKISKLNGHSLINLNFNFTKEYVSGLILSILLSFIILMYGIVIGASYDLIFFLAFALFGITMALEGYNVSVTKKKFLEELYLFVQLVYSSRNDHTEVEKI